MKGFSYTRYEKKIKVIRERSPVTQRGASDGVEKIIPLCCQPGGIGFLPLCRSQRCVLPDLWSGGRTVRQFAAWENKFLCDNQKLVCPFSSL